MKLFIFLIVIFSKHVADTLSLPGPMVYVVTPASRKADEGRSAPFYYHNWMRRMDQRNETTTTTTEKVKTPDLIFAEFEAGNKMKSIRQLLEKEKIEPKTTTSTTMRPVHVSEHKSPVYSSDKQSEPDRTDYFALYNNMYNGNSAPAAPVYLPSTTQSSTTTTTTTTPASHVEDIWHIIDNEKYDSNAGQWEEQLPYGTTNNASSETPLKEDGQQHNEDNTMDNFVFPGFQSNSGMAENESRAIRTEQNLRFPYVNLKPFQMKTQKNAAGNSKKGNNMNINLDNIYDIKNPVRGEAQDVVPMQPPIDRYNPAQPYLPNQPYGSKAKQSSPQTAPVKAVASLVPPPPPPVPKVTDNDFPAPISYESFPPYAPSGPSSAPAPAPDAAPPPKPPVIYEPPVYTSDDSSYDSSSSDDNPIDLEYNYKPSPPIQTFLPTIPPMPKQTKGYSYDTPPPVVYSPPDTKPDFNGYNYNKPDGPPFDDHGFPHDDYHHGYHYHPTTTTTTEMPRVNRYSYYYLGKKLYYLPLYFSVYFIIYVGALIIKAVLRHKIVYPNSWRPNDMTASYFAKRSINDWNLSDEKLHEITGKVSHALAVAGERYFNHKKE